MTTPRNIKEEFIYERANLTEILNHFAIRNNLELRDSFTKSWHPEKTRDFSPIDILNGRWHGPICLFKQEDMYPTLEVEVFAGGPRKEESETDAKSGHCWDISHIDSLLISFYDQDLKSRGEEVLKLFERWEELGIKYCFKRKIEIANDSPYKILAEKNGLKTANISLEHVCEKKIERREDEHPEIDWMLRQDLVNFYDSSENLIADIRIDEHEGTTWNSISETASQSDRDNKIAEIKQEYGNCKAEEYTEHGTISLFSNFWYRNIQFVAHNSCSEEFMNDFFKEFNFRKIDEERKMLFQSTTEIGNRKYVSSAEITHSLVVGEHYLVNLK